jgi:hypothetical protein
MADFGRYKHYVTEQTIAGSRLLNERPFRCYTPTSSDQKRFDQVYEWMHPGLASGKADHASVATF